MTALFFILAGLYLTLLLAKAGLAVALARKESRVAAPEAASHSFTVAQAILSGDAGLRDALEKNLSSLPGQNFLWLIDEEDAEAGKITRGLKAAHAEASIEIVACPPCPEGVNPKLFKLNIGRAQVRTPFLVVLDDDTFLPARTADMLVHQAGSHEVATGLPWYIDGGDFCSSLLAQFVNNNSAMTYLSTMAFTGPITLNGMCYAMRSERAECFAGIRNHLTDDLALATRVREQGGRIYQSALPQFLKTEVRDFTHYARLMHRWYLFAILLLRNQRSRDVALVGVLHGVHPLLLWAVLGIAVADPTPAVLAGAAALLAARSAVLCGLQKVVFKQVQHNAVTSLVSELLQPAHMLHAQLSRKITWRTRRYRVLANDRFVTYE